MRQAQQRLVAFLDGAMREAGYGDVRSAHASVLATIEREGSRLGALAERGGRTKQATAELASTLVERGYASLTPDAADGRAKLYRVTESGRTLLIAAEKVVVGYEEWLDRLLGTDAIGQLRRALTAIVSERV